MEWNIKLIKLRQFWRYIFNVDNLIIVTFLPGKTLLIRAVANESKAYLIQVGPEIISKFQGKSEESFFW
ncbi:hypothetical protein LCGC14_1623040 [marine sediment metagenome]|uniref:Uncharacterized protein n=1 Tax=marine sediment metagenome TaxID=412755 RepID=A0A0F9KKH5_9ZZZZ